MPERGEMGPAPPGRKALCALRSATGRSRGCAIGILRPELLGRTCRPSDEVCSAYTQSFEVSSCNPVSSESSEQPRAQHITKAKSVALDLALIMPFSFLS